MVPVCSSFSPPVNDSKAFPITVPKDLSASLAFIAKPGASLPGAGGKPVIILHIVVAWLGSSDIPLSIKKVDGAYGTELATFAGRDSQPIRKLTLTLHRSFKVHGKRQNFVSARCSHGKLRYKGRFTYVGSPPLSATSTQRCTTRR